MRVVEMWKNVFVTIGALSTGVCLGAGTAATYKLQTGHYGVATTAYMGHKQGIVAHQTRLACRRCGMEHALEHPKIALFEDLPETARNKLAGRRLEVIVDLENYSWHYSPSRDVADIGAKEVADVLRDRLDAALHLFHLDDK